MHYTLVSVPDAASDRLIGGLNPAPGAGQGLSTGTFALDVWLHRAFLVAG
jgi:hypothetical protein